MIEISISKYHLREVIYEMKTAHNLGINTRPYDQMEYNLGINVIRAAPRLIMEIWICLVIYDGDFPDYIKEIELNPHNEFWLERGVDLLE